MRNFKALLLLCLFACLSQAGDFINGQAARAVVGQYGFTYADNVFGQQVVGAVGGLAWANGTLYVADSSPLGTFPPAPNSASNGPVTVNNRVLFFNTNQIPSPTANLAAITPIDSYNCNVCGYSAFNVLGEPDYVTTVPDYPLPNADATYGTPTQSNLRGASGVATDGHILAVADTFNNRILIWTSIPSTKNAPADIVLGQSNFTSSTVYTTPTASSVRAPQGVWIQNGKLYVADTQDDRVLVWNNIPTSNNQPADLVLGQPNFTSVVAPPPQSTNPTTAANELLDPTGVSSDGVHLFVADRGYNRVLIWNSIPTSTDQPADVVIGQPLMTTSVPDWNTHFCASNGSSNGTPTYPVVCAGTLDTPSFVLPDGTGRLFVADQGNDRVLIYNSIPTQNGANADIVLGQPNFTSQVITSQAVTLASTAIDNTAAVDLMPSPTSLAYDGTNLYVSDPYNLRVLVFSPGDVSLPDNSVVNWASEIIRQEGAVTLTLTGTITAGDVESITIGSATAYTYTVKSKDTLDDIAQGLVNAINSSNSGAGDPNATAIFAGTGTATVFLSSKGINLSYDSIALSFTSDSNDDITGATSGAYLSAGTAATAAPGMLVEIDGSNLTDYSAPVVASLSGGGAPTTLGGVQVFMDGISAPLYRVSNIQIITQIPFLFYERNSTSIVVRTVRSNGTVTVSNATPVYIAPANPGLFATPIVPNQSPVLRPAQAAFHQPGNPEAVIDFEGTITAGNTATITVNGRAYTYTVASSDTLTSVTQALISKINAGPDPQVTASLGPSFNRVVLTAKQGGAAGNGIPITTSTSTSATISLTAYTSTTCCDVTPGTAVTASNPAAPGEAITISAAGLGSITDPTGTAQNYSVAGEPYNGPQPNSATNSVTATMGGSTAEVVAAGFAAGAYGVYQIQMIVPTSLTTNNSTQLYVAQNAFVSNIVTLAVGPAAQIAGSGGSGNSVFTSGITFSATPNPIPPGSNGLGSTTLVWAGAPGTIALYEGNPTSGGGQIALGNSSGQDKVNNIPDGTTFYLQDFTAANPKSLNATLATVTVHVESGIAIGIDSPSAGTSYNGTAHFGGWTLDSLSYISTVVIKIDGVSVGNASYGGSRPDVCKKHSAPNCPNVGWNFYYDTSSIANGIHTLEVSTQSANGDRITQAAQFTVNNPVATNGTLALIDTPVAKSGSVEGLISASGWAINKTAPVGTVAVLIDGASYGNATATSRPDVCTVYGLGTAQGCPNVGWSILIDTNALANGSHTLEVVATANNGQISAAGSTFTVANWSNSNPMSLNIGSPSQGRTYSGMVTFGGWAADANATMSYLTMTIDGVSYGLATYGGNRSDACTSFDYPGCPNVGWGAAIDTTQLADGVHTFALTGTASNGENSTKAVSFRVKNLGGSNPLTLHIDAPAASQTVTGTAQFSGWAVDNNASIASVEILIDNIGRGFAQYGTSRPDVCSAHPGVTGCPNVGWTFSFDTTSLTYGSHTLAVKALSSSGEYATIGSTFSVVNSSAGNPVSIAIDQPASHTSPYEGLAQFSGWAVDTNAAVSAVAISIDGVPYGNATYGISRTDICASLASGTPGCPNVGWSYTLDTTRVPDGTHYLGVDVTAANGDHSIVSWVFTIGNWSAGSNAFHISIDSPNSTSPPYFGNITAGGWALNLDVAIASVQVSVDGVPVGNAIYGGSRADACVNYSSAPGCPNVGWGLAIDSTQLSNGNHTIDVTATTVDGQSTTATNTFAVNN